MSQHAFDEIAEPAALAVRAPVLAGQKAQGKLLGQLVGRLGVAASYGVPAAAVERAFEQGVNYLYWGSMRRGGFADALRNLAPQRDRMVLVLQSYSRLAGMLGWSVERGLRKGSRQGARC